MPMTKQQINFIKVVGSGNDFVLIDVTHSRREAGNYRALAKKMCDRKFGVGADGLLVLEKSKIADIRMRIFNADGSEAEMCGNGARCSAYFYSKHLNAAEIKIQTKAGLITAQKKGKNVKIRFTEPSDMTTGIPIKIGDRTIKVNFINTGVPHAVVFVEGLEKIDVHDLGRQIRYHPQFAPKGANVNFVEVAEDASIKVRTYERGVEDETLACGTGSVASALITHYTLHTFDNGRINVKTKSGEVLKVYFKEIGGQFNDVWLEGTAQIVYKGVYYV